MSKAILVWDGTQFVSANVPVGAVPNAISVYSSSQPSNPKVGQTWFNTSTKSLKVWTGSAWIDIYGSGSINVGRGDVYLENNIYDNQDGSGITLRTSNNPTNGSILSVRSSGQAARLWVGQSITSVGANNFYVGTDSIDATLNPAIQLKADGTITANGGWAGTSSSAGKLGGIPMSFTAERNGVGTAGQQMAFGNGAGTIKGPRMPFAGKLIAGTLHGTNVSGTITLDAYVNGSSNSSYRLTGSGSASDVNITQNWQSSPLSFAAGSTINFNQTVVPSSANGYILTFFVVYD